MNVRITSITLLLAVLQVAAAQDGPANPAEPEPVLSPHLIDAYKQIAADLAKPPAPREIAIKTVPAVRVKLFRADPKLLENKFVAQLSLQRQASPNLRGGQRSEAEPLRLAGEALQLLNEPLRTQLKTLAERCPPEARPKQPLIDFLTSEDVTRDVRAGGMFRGFPPAIELTFEVYAPTSAEAEERARAIVQLFDGGFARPVQRALLEEGQKALDQARRGYEDLPKISNAIAAENAKLAKPSEISDDILSQLKAQKVMQTIELVGLNARVKACDAILGDPKRLEISTLQSINDMKVKAEIERVGIKEKLDQINAFIAEGNERKATSFRKLQLSGQRNDLLQTIDNQERMAASRIELFKHFGPLDVPGNEIAVGPVDWFSE